MKSIYKLEKFRYTLASIFLTAEMSIMPFTAINVYKI